MRGAVEFGHATTHVIVHNAHFTVTIGVALGVVTSDVIEVLVVWEVQKQLVCAVRLN